MNLSRMPGGQEARLCGFDSRNGANKKPAVYAGLCAGL